MRIATYNLWNHSSLPQRIEAIIQTLIELDSDVLALQEVPSQALSGTNLAQLLADLLGEAGMNYPHVLYRVYPDDPDEGLGILSKAPLMKTEASWDAGAPGAPLCALRAEVEYGFGSLSMTNLHLDWESALRREQQIVGVMDWLDHVEQPSSYRFLCGDFNASPDSSVYRYLLGQQSLEGAACTPWLDLASRGAAQTGSVPGPTLDFLRNPRWVKDPTLDIPLRVDWLLYQQAELVPWPRLEAAGLFGWQPAPQSGVVPSDHYGVYADLSF